jgi:hypothetical protein
LTIQSNLTLPEARFRVFNAKYMPPRSEIILEEASLCSSDELIILGERDAIFMKTDHALEKVHRDGGRGSAFTT